MSRFKLPGSSLLDRCIGRSTFEYTQAIKLTPFKHNLSYDLYIKTLSKYKPTKSQIWAYTTPFGRLKTDRINLGSSKRTLCLHSEQKGNIEIYDYCCGSIRNSLFMIGNISLIPSKLQEYVLKMQYNLAYYFAEKYPHSFMDQFFDTLYRKKLMDSRTFTSTQSNFFPKWSSSISFVRILKPKMIDFDTLIAQLKKEDSSEDINEYQSELLRHYPELLKFDRNYECDEMYLVLSTRYVLTSNSFLNRLLFLPHWISVKLLASMTQENILQDLGNNLEFVSMKNAENVETKVINKENV